MPEEYEQLLEEVYEKVKKPETSRERFEIPRAEGHIEGKKTVITNFSQMVSYMRRKPEHFLKFMLKELASPGQAEGERLVLNMKVPSSKINQKIEQYAREFVLCRECGKPDTEFVKQDRLVFIHCLACGAKHPVRAKI
jgi:translation initiation factor 2 subunit 2